MGALLQCSYEPVFLTLYNTVLLITRQFLNEQMF